MRSGQETLNGPEISQETASVVPTDLESQQLSTIQEILGAQPIGILFPCIKGCGARPAIFEWCRRPKWGYIFVTIGRRSRQGRRILNINISQ
jgi:hypothetical protein